MGAIEHQWVTKDPFGLTWLVMVLRTSGLNANRFVYGGKPEKVNVNSGDS